MIRIARLAGPLVLSVALVVPLLTTGCYERTRYYDEYHSDYHYWNDGEGRAYRFWIGDRHYGYVEYNHLDRDHQREYWNWRHDHPGRY
jgi:hypothetical protein